MRELREHQSNAIHQIRKALAEGSKRPMLQAPTGAGKTVLAAAIIDLAQSKGTKVIFTVPAISLIDQTVEEFAKEGITKVGVLQANHPLTDPDQPVQVASIQTLQRRKIPEAGLVLVDEAHRNFKFVADWMAKPEWAKVPFIGLSATPWTKGLGKQYDRLIIAATTQDLIDKGYLSPFRVFSPSKPDLSNVRTVAGDYHEGDLSEAMSDKTLTADIVRTWLEKAEGRPTLCFGVDRLHAKTLQAQFEANGVSCGYLDAMSDRDERERVRREFSNGNYQIVANVGVLTTGVDWDVRCIILARPTKSEMLYTQIVGRGLRTANGKDDCIILDHSDTTLRLGFVTDIHHESLCDGKPNVSAKVEAKERKPVECPQCHYVRKPGIGSCPACGHVATRVSEVETVDGELIEMKSVRSAKAAELALKISMMGQLRAYQISTGKAEGWTAHQFKRFFGSWPDDRRVKYAPLKEPTPETLNWIKAQAIRYAKGMAKRAKA